MGAASLLAFVVSACVPTEREPRVIGEARAHAREGHEAYCKGDFEASKQAYGKALELHHSIDDSKGIVRDLVNLAMVSKTAGSTADAATCLDAIDRYIATLEASGSTAADETEVRNLLMEAGWLRAYLEAEAGNPGSARTSLHQTTMRFGQPGPALRGRYLNLEARLDLDEGNFTAALDHSRLALKANRGSDDPKETADSYRLLGRALVATHSPAEAHRCFTKALEIDRAHGRAAKVVDDLLGMAEACRANGQESQASAYAKRALVAAQSAGDESGAARARHFLTKS